MNPLRHDRSAEHYARCERARQSGETLIDAMTRLAVIDALACCPLQKDAAKLLLLSPRMMTYYVRKFGLTDRPRRRDFGIRSLRGSQYVEEDVA
jgi:hypothetical protein